MRCINCGWENENGVMRCIKCGQQLMTSPTDGYKRMAALSSDESNIDRGVMPRSTSLGVSGSSKTAPRPTRMLDKEVSQCPNCGYPLLEGVASCPMCGTEIDGKTQKTPPPTIMGLHHVLDNLEHKFSLELIPEEGEQTDAIKLKFQGNEVILNRDNTEPNNRTITTKEQAVLSYKDGKWFIENRSEFKTTFMRVSRMLELESGDIIVLGDRSFRFKPE